MKSLFYSFLIVLLSTSCKEKSSYLKPARYKKAVYWLETSKGRRISDNFSIGGNVKVLWTDSLYEKINFQFKNSKHMLLVYGNSQYALGYKKRRKLVLDSIGVIYLSVPEIKVYNRIRSNNKEFNQLIDRAILTFEKSKNN